MDVWVRDRLVGLGSAGVMNQEQINQFLKGFGDVDCGEFLGSEV